MRYVMHDDLQKHALMLLAVSSLLFIGWLVAIVATNMHASALVILLGIILGCSAIGTLFTAFRFRALVFKDEEKTDDPGYFRSITFNAASFTVVFFLVLLFSMAFAHNWGMRALVAAPLLLGSFLCGMSVAQFSAKRDELEKEAG